MREQNMAREFRIDLKGLVRLLAQHLYPEKDVFVRELLQNAHDALSRRVALEGSVVPLAIHVSVDRAAGTIQILDNGGGLTRAEIEEYLSTIGRSGTAEFRQKLIELGRQAGVTLIGQYGIGLLSSFVVAESVDVVTRSSQSSNEAAWLWRSAGDKTYTLEQAADDDQMSPGTTVTLHIPPSDQAAAAFLDAETLRRAICKYADFLPYPIYLDRGPTPVNAMTPPWDIAYQSEAERLLAYQQFLNRRFPDWVLHVIPVDVPEPVRIKGALYISDEVTFENYVTGSVDLYQSGMFVEAGNRQLLPTWAKFVGGIVDARDLTLTLSRDGVQRDEHFDAVQRSLGRTILDGLESLAQSDPKKLQSLLRWHGTALKKLALENPEFFKTIADLVPFETNRGILDLPTYLGYSTSASTQVQSIWYFTEAASRSLFNLLADEQGLLLIDASSAWEEDFLRRYAVGRGITLHIVDKPETSSIFEPLSSDARSSFFQLEVEMRNLIRDPSSTVQVVSFRPAEVPAVVSLESEGNLISDARRARDNVRLPESIRALIGRMESRTQMPTNVFINANNELIQKLVALDLRSEIGRAALLAIYHNALLTSGRALRRDDLETITRQANHTLELLLGNTLEVEHLRRTIEARSPHEGSQLELPRTEHVSCFIAMPFKGYDLVAEALREVVEDLPFCWQLVRADEEQLDFSLYGNVFRHIMRAHCYVAEVSDQNFNVGLELGLMMQLTERPIILLRHEHAGPVPADIKGAIHLAYPNPNTARKSDLVDHFRTQLQRIAEVRRLDGAKHYLSTVVLSRSSFGLSVAEAAERQFLTAEAFVSADPRRARELSLSPVLFGELQSWVREIYGLGGNQ